MAPAVTEAEQDPAHGLKSRRSGRAFGQPTQRDRLVAAVGELTVELGMSAVGVHHICQRAGISRRTFYELYADREACALDAIGEAQSRLVAHVTAAVAQAGPEWEDRVVAATRTLVAAVCADPILGHLCVVAPPAAGPDALALRRAALDEIAQLLGPPPPVDVPAELVLDAALGGVWELLRNHLSDGVAQQQVTTAAINALLAPFVGRRRAATRAQTPGDAAPFVTRWTPEADGHSVLVTELTRLTLAYLDAHPDATNVEIARAVDVRHESQMSRHLARLRRAGMVQRRKEGRSNAWQLTARGQDAAGSMRDAQREVKGSI
jgi:AcrR family transcriptional regulator